jgi:hypothetical protein
MSHDSIRVVFDFGTNFRKQGDTIHNGKNKTSERRIVPPIWFRGWLFIFSNPNMEKRELGQVRVF